MATFSIETANAAAVASQLDAEEQQIVAAIRNTIQVAGDMAATWRGTAPAAFQQAKTIWDEGISKMDVGMQNACQVLRQNVNNYHQTDDSLSGLFSGFQV